MTLGLVHLLARKARTFLYLVTHSHFSLILHKLLLNRSNALPFPQRYKYIAISSHGAGMGSFVSMLHCMDYTRRSPDNYYRLDVVCQDSGPGSTSGDDAAESERQHASERSNLGAATGQGGRLDVSSWDSTQSQYSDILPIRDFDLNHLASQIGPSEVPCFSFPHSFHFVMWRYRGLVIDMALRPHAHADSFRILRNMKKRVPIIWLVRDPISLLLSSMNLSFFMYGNKFNDTVAQGYLLDTNDTIDYSDMYDQVRHACSDIHILDTNDISTYSGVKSTMQSVAKILGATYVDIGENINHGRLIARTFPIRAHYRYEDTFVLIGTFSKVKSASYENVHVYGNVKSKNPECLSIDFCESKIFVNKLIRVGGNLMCVAVTGRHRRRLSRELEENAGMLENVRSIALRHCERMERVIADIQTRYSVISPAELIDYLKQRDSLCAPFYRKLKQQVSVVQELRPDIVEKWDNYNAFMSYAEGRFGQGSGAVLGGV